MEQITKVVSNLVSIGDIIDSNFKYNIPRYQRLYVWQPNQVSTLLFDLYEAYISQKNHFHLGNVLLVQPNEQKELYDLVDGQQRFTTLWLLSLEIGGELKAFTQKSDNSMLLEFSIREDVKDYFQNLLEGGDENIFFDENLFFDEKKEGGSLGRIKDARKEIQSFLSDKFKDNPVQKALFGDFIKEKVQLIETIFPKDANLSKLFEVINNRGIQLQQQDILKSYLLSKIGNQSERIQYSKIWNACANMDDYIDRSLSKELGMGNLGAYMSWAYRFNINDILDICKKSNAREVKPKKIEDILKSSSKELLILSSNNDEIGYHQDAQEDEYQKVRSILTFPQLLLHTLRIYLVQNKQKDIYKLSEKELLNIFKNHFINPVEKEVKTFIKLMWTVRELFDKHVIKWVELEPNNEVLMLKKIERKNRIPGSPIWFVRHRIDNTIQNKESELLQSMLYHSQQNATQYWLTPYLYRLLETENEANVYLKKIDNRLFSHNEKEDTLIQRTRKLMDDKHLDSEIDYSILYEPLGTSFTRYWFYKLEYVLWHELNSLYKDWKDYRINARNSIEHISPQAEEFKADTVNSELLHSFGNLALVSRKFNSELSNKPFKEKKERFLYKKNAGDIESLKLDLVYENANWGDENCQKHFDYIITILEQYFQKTQ